MVRVMAGVTAAGNSSGRGTRTDCSCSGTAMRSEHAHVWVPGGPTGSVQTIGMGSLRPLACPGASILTDCSDC
jgi:hypothetical protein